MQSERLIYRPLAPGTLDAFHRLVQDEHVRRYMMDGQIFPREWSEARMRESQALLERRGVTIWLAQDKASGEVVGFCGFWVAPSFVEPQLLYALRERWTGRGLATEMARAAIAHARSTAGFDEIVADADEVNAASLRVLEKLGFERVGVRPGAFGSVLLLRLPAGR
jgi:RimJ/RimL family protein N-acetyltransferase